MNKMHMYVVMLLTAVCFNASASLITYERIALPSGNISDLKSIWDSSSETPNAQTINKFEGVRSGNNIISHVSIALDLAIDNTWTIDLGLDAGLGTEFYLNGTKLFDTNADKWWGYNWNNAFTVADIALSKGANKIDIFWAEKCCNVANAIRLTDHRTQNVSVLSTDILDAASIPEPASVALLGLGLLGFAVRKRVTC